MHAREKCHRPLLPHFSFHILFFSPNICMLLTLNTVYLWRPVMYDYKFCSTVGSSIQLIHKILVNTYVEVATWRPYYTSTWRLAYRYRLLGTLSGVCHDVHMNDTLGLQVARSSDSYVSELQWAVVLHIL